MQIVDAERGFSHFCNSWILLCNRDMRQFVLNVFADMFPEYTASFVPRQQETISKSNCLSAACLNAAGTVPPAFPSVGPGVIPSHLIPVNLELARTQTLVNPQLSWLFQQFIINCFFFFPFVSESGGPCCPSAVRGLKGEAPGWPTHCLSAGTSQLSATYPKR